jgi:histone H3/H4
MADIPMSNVRRLMIEGAGEIRISGDALTKSVTTTATFVRRLGERAASIARGHGRKTIMVEDLDAATQMLLPP